MIIRTPEYGRCSGPFGAGGFYPAGWHCVAAMVVECCGSLLVPVEFDLLGSSDSLSVLCRANL